MTTQNRPPFIGLAEIFPSGAWSIDRRVINRPEWLRDYQAYHRRNGLGIAFLFRATRPLEEVRGILFRYMRRAGITPADTMPR